MLINPSCLDMKNEMKFAPRFGFRT